ncbi:MAG: ArsR family transcriptional regulator [Planctomycetes bacterium]|nr:ArsR family transcriptional regulator [Planctomycetota bacterium]
MLSGILGSEDAERVLLYILAREQGYGREISQFWGTTQTGVKRQLERLEAAGILMAQAVGRTRVYTWNPRYPFARELQALLARAVSLLPDTDRERLLMHRRRPRRTGKPL